MATPDERAPDLRGNLNTRAERSVTGKQKQHGLERIRGKYLIVLAGATGARRARDLVGRLQVGLMVPGKGPLPRLPRCRARGRQSRGHGATQSVITSLHRKTDQRGRCQPPSLKVNPLPDGGQLLWDREYWDTTAEAFSYEYLACLEI